MIFKDELIRKIVRGEKIQTRRPVKANEVLSGDGETVFTRIAGNFRRKIEVGRDYAVVSGRGKPVVYWRFVRRGELFTEHEIVPFEQYKKLEDQHGKTTVGWYLQLHGYKPLRILVTGIRREDVRNISLDDAMAEGFDTRNEFWDVWCGFYDAPGLKIIAAHKPHNVIVQAGLLQERPDELYQAWAYTFEVLR